MGGEENPRRSRSRQAEARGHAATSGRRARCTRTASSGEDERQEREDATPQETSTEAWASPSGGLRRRTNAARAQIHLRRQGRRDAGLDLPPDRHAVRADDGRRGTSHAAVPHDGDWPVGPSTDRSPAAANIQA